MKETYARELNSKGNSSFQRTLQVTNTLIGRLGLEQELEGHMGCVNCLEWNEKGTLLASGSDDVQVILWDPFRKKKVTNIRTGHQGNIFSIKFLPNSDDSILVSGAADSNIRVHDLNTKETTHVFTCHVSRVKRLATAPNLPFMFWSAAEDGCIMQYDLRSPESCQSNGNNVLINLNAHIGGPAECKCLAINPQRPEQMAVGANDPYVRVYDRRMLTCRTLKNSDEGFDRASPSEFGLPHGCVDYYIAGHIPQKKDDYKKKLRALAATYVTFSPDGTELLVNLGGEQIYLFDVNSKRRMQKFETSMVLSTNGYVKDAACSANGFSLHCNGTTTNGVTNGVSKHLHAHTSKQVVTEGGEPGDYKPSVKKHKIEKKALPPFVESLKKKANQYFEKEQYTKAIILYNQAIYRAPQASMLFGNRAAAYMKRKWDGDLYAALRDCQTALRLDINHLKAHFRLAKCLHELSWPKEAFECLNHFKAKFPDYAKSRACEQLDKDIRAAIFARTEQEEKSNYKSDSSDLLHSRRSQPSEEERMWRGEASDYEARFCGHCNTTTDIKEANFFGSNGQYIVAGSDDGSFFIWEKSTTNIVRVLRGDDSIVNCLQPHPSVCLLATSGIDPVVRLWSPRPEDGSKNDREVDNSDDAALANQKRMNADPLEVMLMNMGYRLSGAYDVDEDEEHRPGEAHVACPTS